MTPQDVLTLLEHGGLAAVLYLLLTRVMDRLDKVTDHLIEIVEAQEKIHAAIAHQVDNTRD